jgi:hypothetical protein
MSELITVRLGSEKIMIDPDVVTELLSDFAQDIFSKPTEGLAMLAIVGSIRTLLPSLIAEDAKHSGSVPPDWKQARKDKKDSIAVGTEYLIPRLLSYLPSHDLTLITQEGDDHESRVITSIISTPTGPQPTTEEAEKSTGSDS